MAEPTEIGETLENGESRRDPFIGEDSHDRASGAAAERSNRRCLLHDEALHVAVARARHSGNDADDGTPRAGTNPGQPDGEFAV